MTVVRDPVRLEVLKNALEGIADGMAITVVRTSRSAVVRQALDFSTGVLNANAELIAQGACIPAHLGGMPVALEACLARYGDRISPGDIFANNDPYEGGSHLPDIFLYKPVFVNGRVAAYTCAMAHHTDIGGRVAGGNACDNSEIYQEGLRIPPLKLYEAGVINETLWRLLEKAVRVPDMVLGDLQACISALEYGERHFLKLVEQHGLEDLEQSMAELLDYTEELTRRAIRALPDGAWSFTDYIDDDGFDAGPIALVTSLRKQGDQFFVDFTGTSPQVKGSIQPVFATTKAMVYAVVKTILSALGYEIPNTQGYFRPVTVTAPEGCFLNPIIPAAVAARGLSLVRITQSVFGAFAQMLPNVAPACSGGAEVGVSVSGYDKRRTPWRPWVHMDFNVEQARGGAATREGLDAHFSGIMCAANVPAEVMEIDHPVRLRQYGFAQDSEGAGTQRGGMGITREWEFQMDDTVMQLRSDRQKHPPYGLYGGKSAAPTQVVTTSAGQEKRMKSKFIWTAGKGDRLRISWSGGGGWGDPMKREPQKVLWDVIEEKVSVQKAREVYGVVIDKERRAIDWEATRRLRAEKKKAAATPA